MTLPSGVTPNATLDRLINAAQRAAIVDLLGQPATPGALTKLAHNVRLAILNQVLLGHWRTLGVVDADDFAALRVTARLGKAFGEPSIVVEYDFTQTSKPHIVVVQGAK